MREVVFTSELRGNAAPVAGKESTLVANTAGSGPEGEAVSFQSEVVLNGGTFKESGNIQYAGRGSLRFETVGVGYLGASPLADLQRGAVIWTVTEGDKEFVGATGLITSNFTVSAGGEVVDNHYVRLFVP